MDTENPYQPPSADTTTPTHTAEDITSVRKKLVPKWIKIFGWLFMVFGALMPLLVAASLLLQEPLQLGLFGLNYNGPATHPAAILMASLIIALAIAAFGLLFAKGWGVKVCLALGYLCSAICLFTMVHNIMSGHLMLRLELVVLFFYLRRLHRIAPLWQPSGEQPAEINNS
ncbi:hypothetical protein QSV34_11090 [Porticoccus sp. W117]|uniref:hypothetical protein n=1 Tax=Porticoccus sp. W117 TaxID=3054777 RepID=UPI002592952D|nr:hypothetical protein [Porticoccus sp. W117]MDM3871896.1 hypothetical protein [Porticoccus sp. W117]